MPFPSRKWIFIDLFFIVLFCSAWLYFQRFSAVAMERYVPETALGYIAVDNLPQLLDQFTATDAWKQLAPLYEVNDKVQYAGWANRLGRWTGIGTKESLLLARGQFALVISGLEVRGDEVKPRLALVIETHGSAAAVNSLIESQMPKLAQRALKQAVPEKSEYSGIPITIYRVPNTDRQMLTAGLGSTWLIANDAATLQACIDVRQGRVASVAANPLLAQAKAEVDPNGAAFAFVSNSGAARLSQFFTHLFIGKAIAATPLAGMPESIMSEIAEGTVEAMAYSASFDSGGLLDRYAILCKPEVMSELQEAVRVAKNSGPEKSAALKLVPANALDVAMVQMADPGQALDGIERVISGHLGIAQSFLFHQFFTSARKTFLGLEPGENPGQSVGSEVVRFSLATDDSDTSENIWLIAARNQPQLAQLAERLLRQQGHNISRLNHQGTELVTNRKRAFAFAGNYLVMGNTISLMRYLEAANAPSIVTSPQFVAAKRSHQMEDIVMHGFSSVAKDTHTMMSAIANRLKGNPQAEAEDLLQRLPLSVSITSLNARGIQREVRSPVGQIPTVIGFAASVF